MCCVKGDNAYLKSKYTQNCENAKAALPFTSDTIVWLGKHAGLTSKQYLCAIQDVILFLLLLKSPVKKEDLAITLL
jgi:hypothetical protein